MKQEAIGSTVPVGENWTQCTRTSGLAIRELYSPDLTPGKLTCLPWLGSPSTPESIRARFPNSVIFLLSRNSYSEENRGNDANESANDNLNHIWQHPMRNSLLVKMFSNNEIPKRPQGSRCNKSRISSSEFGRPQNKCKHISNDHLQVLHSHPQCSTVSWSVCTKNITRISIIPINKWATRQTGLLKLKHYS